MKNVVSTPVAAQISSFLVEVTGKNFIKNAYELSHEMRKAAFLPNSSGVYVLFDQAGQLIYVGQSTGLRYRLYNHKYNKKFEADRFAYFPLPQEALNQCEEEAIFHLQPLHNKRHKYHPNRVIPKHTLLYRRWKEQNAYNPNHYQNPH